METTRVARLIVAVRREKRLRQADLALLADVSQSLISRAEHGRMDRMSLAVLDRITRALDIDLFLDARWRGGLGDRLVDRDHAALVERVVSLLEHHGWDIVVEYTFNHFGERGSVDVLAYHAGARALLIVEVKATLTDLQAFLASFDRKRRLVPDLVQQDRGWETEVVGRILVAADSTANRRVVDRHRSMFDTTLAGRARDVERWVRSPTTDLAAIWFTRPVGSTSRRSTLRVRSSRSTDVPGTEV